MEAGRDMMKDRREITMEHAVWRDRYNMSRERARRHSRYWTWGDAGVVASGVCTAVMKKRERVDGLVQRTEINSPPARRQRARIREVLYGEY